MSPASAAALACSTYCRTWPIMASWLEVVWRPESFFKFAAVSTSSRSIVWRWLDACCSVRLGDSCSVGSLVPPFRTTTFLGLEFLVGGFAGCIPGVAAFEAVAVPGFFLRRCLLTPRTVELGFAGSLGGWVAAGAAGRGVCPD